MSKFMDGKDARSMFFDARPYAVVIVIGSGAILFLMAWALQAIAWDVPYSFGVTLPWTTELFAKMFGLRPHSYLFLVTLWFWWPMVASLVYCLSRYGYSPEFGIAFIYLMTLCWMLVGIGLALIACLLSLPRYILLANVEQPPSFMLWVPTISWCLPICVIVFSAFCMWQYRCITVSCRWRDSKEK